MENSLYVGSLSEDATVDGLRTRFATCGQVVDVQLPIDRGSGRLRGHAFVTMADAAGVKAALTQLNGVTFEGRPLRLSIAGEDRYQKQPKAIEPARITSQYRERDNMAYELDCAGVKMLIKIFYQDDPSEARRVEVSTKRPAGEEPVACAASGKKARLRPASWSTGLPSPAPWRASAPSESSLAPSTRL